MDISIFGIAGVAAITVICYLIGQGVKASGLDNKWIPVIVGGLRRRAGRGGDVSHGGFPCRGCADCGGSGYWSAALRPPAWIRQASSFFANEGGAIL